MLKNTQMLLQELGHYADPHHRIARMVRDGRLVRLTRGLYADNLQNCGPIVANLLCAPSYLSFEYALSCYDLIPEAIRSWTSATWQKRKKKVFRTPIGFFFYRDIPTAAYPWEVTLCTQPEGSYLLASPEKALCDQLCVIEPLQSQKDLEDRLFDDMRIAAGRFFALNMATLLELSPLYRKKNLDLLHKYTKRRKK